MRDYLYAKWFTPGDISNIPSSLALADGVLFDLGGGDWTFATITGAGTIGSANVTVTGSVQPGLVVDGALAFASGATLDVAGLSAAPDVFLTAKSITGAPASVQIGGETVKLRVKDNKNGTFSLVPRSGNGGAVVIY